MLGDFLRAAHFRCRHIHAVRDFFNARLMAKFLHKLARSADQLINDFNHMDGDTDRAGLVRNRPADGLADPPRGIGGEFVAAAVIKFVHRFHQTHIAFLDQVQELQASVGVLFCNRNHQPEVGFNEFTLSIFRIHISLYDLALRAAQLLKTHAGFLLEFLQVTGAVSSCPLILRSQCRISRALLLLFQRVYLVTQRAHGLCNRRHLVDQPFTFRLGIFQAAQASRYRHFMASQAPPIPQMQLWSFYPAYVFELFFQPALSVVMLIHLLDPNQGGLQAFGNYFVGSLFMFVKDHNLFDGPDTPLQIRAQGDYLPDRERRPRNRLECAEMSALKSLGYVDFTLSGKKRYSSHFPQIDPHWITGPVPRFRR